MNKAQGWAFGIVVGALAMGDWAVSTAPAGGDAAKLPHSLTVAGVTVTASQREVELDGKKERHLFLSLAGHGAGSLAVRLVSITGDRMSRVASIPGVVWTKAIPFDTNASTSIDLGTCDPQPARSYELLGAATDKSAFCSLLRFPDGRPIGFESR